MGGTLASTGVKGEYNSRHVKAPGTSEAVLVHSVPCIGPAYSAGQVGWPTFCSSLITDLAKLAH